MSMVSRMYWLHALTPVHVGAGTGVGFIDLPLQREKATGWPVIPGTSVKGVIADYYGATVDKRRSEDEEGRIYRLAFGLADSETAQGANSGSLVFADARLVCFPVRSLYGTFAWVSCPLALKRLARDLSSCNLKAPEVPSVAEGQILLGSNSQLAAGDKVYLEDLDFQVGGNNAADWGSQIAEWIFQGSSWAGDFRRRFAIVSDDTFNYLVTTATEVVARVRISDEKKTVERGALWYEEYLPAESVLAGLVWCDRIYGDVSMQPAELLDRICRNELSLQIGGKATVGKGRVRCIFVGG